MSNPEIVKETFLQDSEFEAFSTLELLEMLKQPLILKKGRALFELARRSSEDNDLLERVVEEVNHPQNKSTRTVGIVSISFLGIAGLLYSSSEQGKKTATELIDRWEEPDRSSLIEFLDDLFINSESLTGSLGAIAGRIENNNH